MNELSSPRVFKLVEDLGRFWILRRRTLVQTLKGELRAAEQRYVAVQDEHSAAQRAAEAECARLLASAEALKAKCAERDAQVNQLQADLGQSAAKYESLHASHSVVSAKYQLVSRLLAARPATNQGLERFKELLHHGFMKFANQEPSLAEEARAVLTLQAVEKELELIVGFPSIYCKNIVAVAGGFSSGKSEFVNSFIRDPSVRLSVGLNPVTAIPAYVTGAVESAISAYSASGGCIRLQVEEFRSISHDFVKSFEFDLKSIMPYVSVGTALDEELFRFICFVDTPGYDPASTEGYTDSDREIACQYARQSTALIWVIGLDSNGTVPASDVRFIKGLELKEDVALYLVANKADLRSEDDLEDILDNMEDVLADEGISYSGISAYSSVQGQEITHRRKPLSDFFAGKNQEVEARQRLVDQVVRVFDSYREATGDDIHRAKRITLGVKSMLNDILEAGEPELFRNTEDRFADIKKEFAVRRLSKFIKEANRLQAAMTAAIDSAIGDVVASATQRAWTGRREALAAPSR